MAAVIVLTVVLAGLAVLQAALVLGAPLGRFAWGGQHRVLPARLRVGSAVSIAVYGVIGLIAWDRADAIDLFGETFSEVAMWVCVAFFVLSIGSNAMSRSRPERLVMAPVSVVLAAAAVVVALG
ncbi:hypothetical protein [Demequina subtropica]|uniref:hypothetical protein n=1 Tax=Demequina subtropica TaxID=1638989 RepID=UPI0007848537|nr:hypothetical protein [Demequina subtropica]